MVLDDLAALAYCMPAPLLQAPLLHGQSRLQLNLQVIIHFLGYSLLFFLAPSECTRDLYAPQACARARTHTHTHNIYTCIRIYIHTHTYMHTYMPTYIHTYMYTYNLYTHAYIHTTYVWYIHTCKSGTYAWNLMKVYSLYSERLWSVYSERLYSVYSELYLPPIAISCISTCLLIYNI